MLRQALESLNKRRFLPFASRSKLPEQLLPGARQTKKRVRRCMVCIGEPVDYMASSMRPFCSWYIIK